MRTKLALLATVFALALTSADANACWYPGKRVVERVKANRSSSCSPSQSQPYQFSPSDQFNGTHVIGSGIVQTGGCAGGKCPTLNVVPSIMPSQAPFVIGEKR